MTLLTRLKLWGFGLLAAAGTIAAVLYAINVSSAAKTSLDVALLVFTCAAAVIAFLGLIVTWLGYRLEVGRVPKPDLEILDGGKTTRRWEIEIELLGLEDTEVAAEVARETRVMEASIAKLEEPRAKRASNSIFDFDVSGHVSDDAMTKYRGQVSDYLETYEAHFREKRAFDALSARSHDLAFALTNNRAGVPAEGVRAIIHIPDDVQVLDRSDFPPDPGMPGRPRPPRASSGLLGTLAALNRGFDTSSFLPSVRPFATFPGRPSNVSRPKIRPGSSTEIEFAVGEILHNLGEDTHETPVVLVFPHGDTWTIKYEIHARNLPNPKRGELRITAKVKTSEAVAAEEG